jgi:hypothetical protein
MKNVGDTRGRLLIVFIPAGFEKCRDEVGRFSFDTMTDTSALEATLRKPGLELA